jgi:hypothetical protein
VGAHQIWRIDDDNLEAVEGLRRQVLRTVVVPEMKAAQHLQITEQIHSFSHPALT